MTMHFTSGGGGDDDDDDDDEYQTFYTLHAWKLDKSGQALDPWREFTKEVYFKSVVYFQSMDWIKHEVSVIQRV